MTTGTAHTHFSPCHHRLIPIHYDHCDRDWKNPSYHANFMLKAVPWTGKIPRIMPTLCWKLFPGLEKSLVSCQLYAESCSLDWKNPSYHANSMLKAAPWTGKIPRIMPTLCWKLFPGLEKSLVSCQFYAESCSLDWKNPSYHANSMLKAAPWTGKIPRIMPILCWKLFPGLEKSLVSCQLYTESCSLDWKNLSYHANFMLKAAPWTGKIPRIMPTLCWKLFPGLEKSLVSCQLYAESCSLDWKNPSYHANFMLKAVPWTGKIPRIMPTLCWKLLPGLEKSLVSCNSMLKTAPWTGKIPRIMPTLCWKLLSGREKSLVSCQLYAECCSIDWKNPSYHANSMLKSVPWTGKMPRFMLTLCWKVLPGPD